MAAQVAEELKTVTYATPPMEERRKKKNLLYVLICLAVCHFACGKLSFAMAESLSVFVPYPQHGEEWGWIMRWG